jgi:hypothetical protein
MNFLRFTKTIKILTVHEFIRNLMILDRADWLSYFFIIN